MDVHVNFLAVLLAAVSTMVVGSLWYMPATFGSTWMRLAKVKMDRSKMTPGSMAWMYGSVFVASFITAFVLGQITFFISYYYQVDGYMLSAVSAGILLWLGFTALRLYVHDTFEGRPIKLTVLNATHELVTVLVVALIIGWLHP